MKRLSSVVAAVLLAGYGAVVYAAEQYKLPPACAVEAENFTVTKGWKVVQNGQGNYMVDIIGFNHISGERLLSVSSSDTTASAYADVNIPVAGAYRLWVRYEYPPFTECRFKVTVQQGKQTLAEKNMGGKDNPRLAFGDTTPKAQYDPSWGAEGLVDEWVDVALKPGTARITLATTDQPQTPGVAANRNIDFIYLINDTQDAWRPHYIAGWGAYPILNALLATVGPRWEVQFINQGGKPATFTTYHVNNRSPWGLEGPTAAAVAPGASSAWLPLPNQDTCHFSLTKFTAAPNSAFKLSVRPYGGGAVKVFSASEGSVGIYLPPYANKGDVPVTPMDEIDAVLKLLSSTKAPGRNPTLPLCYGGWLPVDEAGAYGRKYAALYAALGMRAIPPNYTIGQNIPKVLAALKEQGVPASRSLSAMGYRNPPLPENIAKAKDWIAKDNLQAYLQWFDYGDEILFSEWLSYMKGDYPALWRAWLARNRPGYKVGDYWLPSWGSADPAKLKPDSSAAAAAAKPRLYVDSVKFYETTAISFIAEGARAVKAALGQDVRCGANYACHPFYYPFVTMYIHWFRGGAADMGRHSEYFWQTGQAGPQVNGYIAEHFRAGMRNNPKAILRQYTMPHSPGNTSANFLRTAYTHLAHGAKMLDFFGIGMNECFTENHIDHRDHDRYRAIRDLTWSIGLVEDQLLDSTVVPSQIAMLVSDSTERWDLAGIANDQAGHDLFGAAFRTTRLHFHQDRLGIWTALTYMGATPDLLIEEDITADLLKNYRVLYVVGDCLPPELAPALEKWVKAGGVLMATSGAGQFDSYRSPDPAMGNLLGIAKRSVETKTHFLRPRMELPFLQPLAMVTNATWSMPLLAQMEKVEPIKGCEILASFKEDQKPAVFSHTIGKGKIFYAAALPGIAYSWSALQPPAVPDRSPGVHVLPLDFDKGAESLIALPLTAAGFEAPIKTDVPRLDMRLLKGAKAWILPISNYNRETGQKVALSLKIDGKIKRISSAYCGNLDFKIADGRILVTIPTLGYGDILRLDM